MWDRLVRERILPADSPHRNGAAEAAVWIVKKAIQSLGKEPPLSYSEFHAAIYMAANLTNELPIDARVQSREDTIYYVPPKVETVNVWLLTLPRQQTQTDADRGGQIIETLDPICWSKLPPIHHLLAAA